MRRLRTSELSEAVARLVQEANVFLPEDVVLSLEQARRAERSPLGKEVLAQMLENARVAASERLPVCQDTGTAIVQVRLGRDTSLDGDLGAAIDEGVRRGYEAGHLRKSMVKDPLFDRKNTSDNTPALVHVEIIPGDKLELAVLIKGGGSESVGQAAVLRPADGVEGVKGFVRSVVEAAGANPCPPTVVGVGCGGSLDYAAWLAKKALMRPIGQAHADAKIADLERGLLEEINTLGIGPAGLGGRVTSLAVHIETYPCHIAAVPVAVDLSCYALRRKEAIL